MILQLLVDARSCRLVGIVDKVLNGSCWSKLVSHHVPSRFGSPGALLSSEVVASHPRKEVEQAMTDICHNIA